MNRVNISEFRKLGIKKVGELLPIMLVVEGKDFALIDTIKNIIVLSDLHLRVQNNFRAMDAKVRAGMPKPDKIYADEVPATTAL